MDNYGRELTPEERDQIAWEQRKREQREAWEQQREHEREEAQRQQKRAALETHLAERARTYFDHTGTTPAPAMLERWREEYLDQQKLARQAERGEAGRSRGGALQLLRKGAQEHGTGCNRRCYTTNALRG